MISLAEARQAYRGYAPAYDWLFGPLLQRARRQAVRYANDAPGQNVLEIGIGTGLSLPYYRSDARVTGIDVSPEMLDKACDRAAALAEGARCRLLLMNAEDMAFADDSFDVVIALFVASTVQDLARFGAELRRVCKPDGKIVIVNHFSHSGPVSSLLRRYAVRFEGSLGFEPFFPIDRFLSETGLPIRKIAPFGRFGHLLRVEAAKA